MSSDRTPVHVRTLEQSGLVRVDATERDLRDGYERLLVEPQVRTARAGADRVHRLGRARIERRTLRIADLGQELWDANRPSRATVRR